MSHCYSVPWGWTVAEAATPGGTGSCYLGWDWNTSVTQAAQCCGQLSLLLGIWLCLAHAWPRHRAEWVNQWLHRVRLWWAAELWALSVPTSPLECLCAQTKHHGLCSGEPNPLPPGGGKAERGRRKSWVELGGCPPNKGVFVPRQS